MPAVYESYLCHHGVKGMKWGVRKKRVSSARNTNTGDADTNETKSKKSYKKLKIAAGVTVAVGTVAVSAYLANKYKDTVLDAVSNDMVFAERMRKAKDFVDSRPDQKNSFAFDTMFQARDPHETNGYYKNAYNNLSSESMRKEAKEYFKNNYKNYYSDRKNAQRMLHERMMEVRKTAKARPGIDEPWTRTVFDSSRKHSQDIYYLDADNNNYLEKLYLKLYGTR